MPRSYVGIYLYGLILTICGVMSNALAQELVLPEVLVVGEDEPSAEPLVLPKVDDGAGVMDVVAGSTVEASTGLEKGIGGLSWRGFDSRQVGVELDGVEMGLPYDGSVNLDWLGLGLFDGGELRGPDVPGAGGAGALGGTLALRTLSFDAPHGVRVGVWGGSGWSGGAAASLAAETRALGVDYVVAGQVQGRMGLVAPGDVGGTDGLLTNTDRRGSSVLAGVRRVWGQGSSTQVKWLGSWYEAGFQPEYNLLKPRYWRWSHVETHLVTVRHDEAFGQGVAARFQIYGLFPSNTLNAYDDESYSTMETESGFISKYTDLRVGGQGLVRVRWSECGSLLPCRSDFRVGLRFDRHEESEDGAGSFSDSEWRVDLGTGVVSGHWQGLSWGGAVTGFAVVPSDGGNPGWNAVTVAPGLWAEWTHDVVKVRVAGSRKVRFPTLKERFSSALGYREANPDLGPEQSWNVSLSVDLVLGDWFSASVSGWYSGVSDLINEQVSSDGLVRMENTGSVGFAGLSADAVVSPLSWLSARVGGMWMYVDASDVVGGHLSNRPEWRFLSGLDVTPLDWCGAGVGLRVEGDRYYVNRGSRAWERAGGWVFLDISLWVEAGDYRLWLSASNFTDTIYSTNSGMYGEGRSIYLGITAKY